MNEPDDFGLVYDPPFKWWQLWAWSPTWYCYRYRYRWIRDLVERLR